MTCYYKQTKQFLDGQASLVPTPVSSSEVGKGGMPGPDAPKMQALPKLG